MLLLHLTMKLLWKAACSRLSLVERKYLPMNGREQAQALRDILYDITTSSSEGTQNTSRCMHRYAGSKPSVNHDITQHSPLLQAAVGLDGHHAPIRGLVEGFAAAITLPLRIGSKGFQLWFLGGHATPIYCLSLITPPVFAASSVARIRR